MTRKLSLHRLADLELGKAIEYYAENAGWDVARRFSDAYDEIEAEIHRAPFQWAKYFEDYRRRVFTRTWPFSVVYYVTDEQVRVIAVADERKKPLYWQGRR